MFPCKLVFKVKPDGGDPSGIAKFKCRHCGKDYYQKKGVHFICSHAPVSAGTTNHIVVVVATEFGWSLHDMDVSNAYLYGWLLSDTVMFVEPPPTVHVSEGHGLRLLKGLHDTM